VGRINQLSFEVANLIAAGEVVDRPASVIKELVENAIDSGATRITVEIQHGGVLYMRVTDNGYGILPEDLPVAVKRHATSKIKDATDLEAIMTLGFRGEALAAISAVSDVRIISKTPENELGASIEVNSGRAGRVVEQGAQNGTTVIVENLFANVPARLKFLKRDMTEAAAVISVAEKIAMSHPEISFRVISDGNMKLDAPGDGRLISAVRAVYGKEFASALLPVDCTLGGVRAYGYITAPVAPRANRNFQNFFINKRYVKSRTASAALEQAYSSYIPPEKFPGCIICLELSPAAVDVNVHPSKLEVKFSNERPVFECVYHAVRDALTTNTQRPGDNTGNAKEAAAGGSESVQGGIGTPLIQKPVRPTVSGAYTPVRDGERNTHSQMSIADLYKPGQTGEGGAAAKPGASQGSASAARLENAGTAGASGTVGAVSTAGTVISTATAGYPGTSYTAGVSETSETESASRTAGRFGNAEMVGSAGSEKAKEITGVVDPADTLTGCGNSAADRYGISGNAGQQNGFSAAVNIAGRNTELRSGYTDGSTEKDSGNGQNAPVDCTPYDGNTAAPFINYHICGEIFNSYILVTEDDKVTVIDKHAAHERLNFEKMKRRLHGTGYQGSLLMLPLVISLNGEEKDALLSCGKELQKIGFGFTETSGGALEFTEIPAELDTAEATELIEKIADAVVHGTGDASLIGDTVFERALYQASCKASIKAGRTYPEGYNEALVKELMQHPEITYCPHGRPVAFVMTKSEFDKRFKRI